MSRFRTESGADGSPVAPERVEVFGLEARRLDCFQEADASMRHTQKLSVAAARLEHKRGASSEKLNM